MGLLDYLDGGYQRGQDALNAVTNAPPPMLRRPPAPKPPYQSRTPSTYIAPIPNYQPPAQNFQNSGPAFNGGGFSGGGLSNPGVINSGPAMGASAPPPPPPRKTVEDYKRLYDTDDELSGVDSTFGEQRAAYKNALDKFLLQDREGRGKIGRDYDMADQGVERNRVAGLTSLNEDFAARGLGKSGLWLNEKGQAVDQFTRQATNTRNGRKDAISDMDQRKVKMETDTTNNTAAARREAYARLAAKQDLI